MKKNRFWHIMLGLVTCVTGSLAAQNSPVRMELLLSPEFENASTYSPTSLGIDLRGRGKKIVDIIIANETGETQEQLYLWIRFSAARFGTIVELTQRTPFILKPYQITQTDNNRLENDGGLPGVEGGFEFDMTTDRINDFINTLGGSTQLPDDVYSFQAELRKGGNTSDKTIWLVTRNLGAKPIVSTVDLFLLQPGGIVGSDQQITTNNPVFRWDGPATKDYRLIVVKDNKDLKQSPEALIQQAFSTAATLRRGQQTGQGSLLESEIIDAEVQGTAFNVPIFGTQKLQAGEKYYWQVFTLVSAGSGLAYLPSQIWEFRVVDTQQSAQQEVSNEVYEKLKGLVPADRIAQLRDKGFNIISVIVDGKTTQGAASIIIELDQFNQKIKDKKVTLK